MKAHCLCLVLSEPSRPDPVVYPPHTTWLELRWDKIGDAPTGWLEALRSAYDKLIYTYRGDATSATARAQHYAAWIREGVPFVDIDYQEPFLKRLLDEWGDSATRLILSRHIWEYTGNLNSLRSALGVMETLHPYLSKLAVLCQSAEEAAALLSLYNDSHHRLIFAMGGVGGFTRLAAPYLGAPYTYAAYSEAVAPGLLPAPLMQQIFDAWDD